MSSSSQIVALVINLKKAKARWEFQQRQLQSLNIPHQRFEATAVNDLTDKEYEKWANDWQRKLRKTEVACFLSHYRIWRHIASTNQSFLILEDDALLSQKLPIVLTALQNDISLRFDHLTFETRSRKKMISTNSVYKTDEFNLHNLHLDKTGAAAYILTPSGAIKLIDEVKKNGAGLADAMLCHTKSLQKLQSVPALSIQMDMATHYGMPELNFEPVSKSSISTQSSTKPKPNSFAEQLSFKSKRLSAQLDMGIIQARYSSRSNYLEVFPIKKDFDHLNNIIIKHY